MNQATTKSGGEAAYADTPVVGIPFVSQRTKFQDCFGHLDFEHLILFRGSDLGFRISAPLLF